ncbi:hypothetical protein AXX17_AT4G18150 [Arabidopsis thaliana]|uniref:Uncharacterized protein n=1 Tax=Arabidopsis thaliana TaxID=3702 RepID=A0A178UUS1_ARATH|nr:hypothetical protein AXX17_AT4G18150 [Arabidopsis thaliana]
MIEMERLTFWAMEAAGSDTGLSMARAFVSRCKPVFAMLNRWQWIVPVLGKRFDPSPSRFDRLTIRFSPR